MSNAPCKLASLLFHEGRIYGQPEVVRISLPQVATGLRLCLPGSFRRRGFQPEIKAGYGSKGKSIISASAYLNGDVMKNEETGRISYYTSKKEVVYTSLLMCENAPQEWQNVPAENIRRFQKSARYKRADNKEVALKKFKLAFQKQRLWNEVLRIEKSADARKIDEKFQNGQISSASWKVEENQIEEQQNLISYCFCMK